MLQVSDGLAYLDKMRTHLESARRFDRFVDILNAYKERKADVAQSYAAVKKLLAGSSAELLRDFSVFVPKGQRAELLAQQTDYERNAASLGNAIVLDMIVESHMYVHKFRAEAAAAREAYREHGRVSDADDDDDAEESGAAPAAAPSKLRVPLVTRRNLPR